MNRPTISLVCAMANNRVIGQDNKMPWHLPADLKHFKAVTMSKPIVMGRKTYESIGRPLPGRRNVVISRNANFEAEGCDVVSSIDSAIELLSEHEEIMIIGGGFLYSQMIEQADKLHLTFINLQVEGDTHFPAFEQLNLVEISSQSCVADEKNPYDYRFVEYKVE
ncbi:MAG: type 3 dihydrofolate reductase [Kangiellaceae bacterium]|nr:type 3 dihydrofolate reductase [Kangiellaceae bacterium]